MSACRKQGASGQKKKTNYTTYLHCQVQTDSLRELPPKLENQPQTLLWGLFSYLALVFAQARAANGPHRRKLQKTLAVHFCFLFPGPRAHFSLFSKGSPQSQGGRKLGPKTTTKMSIRMWLLCSPTPLPTLVLSHFLGRPLLLFRAGGPEAGSVAGGHVRNSCAIEVNHLAAKGVRQKESGKKVTKKVTEASEKVTEK